MRRPAFQILYTTFLDVVIYCFRITARVCYYMEPFAIGKQLLGHGYNDCTWTGSLDGLYLDWK